MLFSCNNKLLSREKEMLDEDFFFLEWQYCASVVSSQTAPDNMVNTIMYYFLYYIMR